MTDDVAWLDATAQAALVRDGELSAVELVDGAIARIEKLNPELNAVIHPLFDRARSVASGALPDGPFRGVPFLLKDLGAELAGTPFCEGSDFAGDYHSTVDQELTKRFAAAGFVICGKTNTPEFGILPTTEPRRFGPSRNPWNTGHSTGGSSGGSAAAVASGMVPAAHANDGGGSIRIPASCCGLVGLKPTRARVSVAPQYGDMMGGLVAEHVVARSVRDSAAILDCVAGPVAGDPYWAPPLRGGSFAAAVTAAPRPLRLGVVTSSPTGSPVHPDCVAATEAAAALCQSFGHGVEVVGLAVDGDAFTADFINVWAAGNAWVLLDWEERTGRTATEDDVEPLSWALIELGRSIDSGRYLKSLQGLQQMSREIAGYFEDIDVLVTPTLAEPPATLGMFDSPPGEPLTGLLRAAAYVPFTPPFNVTGQPAISLPLHWNGEGLPIGVQFVGRFGDEETLLTLAAELEEAQPWAHRRPAVGAVSGGAVAGMVPDLIGPDLDVLFCGINPGKLSGETGLHFARPGNRFWKLLAAAGFTGAVMAPGEQASLPAFGIGITNLVERATTAASELSNRELRAGAIALASKAEQWRPRCVAVLGLGAYRTAFGRPRADVGEQPEQLGPSRLWLLPNPSGLQARYQLAEMTALFTELRQAVPAPPSPPLK